MPPRGRVLHRESAGVDSKRQRFVKRFSFDRRLFCWIQWFASQSHFLEAAAMFARLDWARWAFLPSILLLVIGARAETPATFDEDPLPVESQWRGKLAQLGTHPTTQFPPEVDAVMTIARRDGNEVEAELRETVPGMDITFLCRGRLIRRADKSLSLEFRSCGVKGLPNSGRYLLDVPYAARLNGDSIKGSWKYMDKTEGIDMGGDFSLGRVKDGE
jgi:hypothetical protein